MAVSRSPEELAEILRTLSNGTALVVKMGGANYADNYFSALATILRDYVMETHGNAIYVSVTNPASLLVDLLSSMDIPTSDVFFVDVTSYMMVAHAKRNPNTSYVESPTMLETIMLRVEYLLQKVKSQKKIVVIDSIGSLAIHNNTAILSEFLHILVNTLKSTGAITILLSVAEETVPELDNILSLVCDQSVVFSSAGGGSGQ
jgi:KaiC/GvpD/RAD55 family RecA-like ATPase